MKNFAKDIAKKIAFANIVHFMMHRRPDMFLCLWFSRALSGKLEGIGMEGHSFTSVTRVADSA
jgi:hypothetical protein